LGLSGGTTAATISPAAGARSRSGPAPTRSLLAWWAASGIGAERDSLPWRAATADPWLVLVSEVMLAQTQARRVAERYPAFVERFGSPAAMASEPLGEVLRAWQGLGYPRRAARLHQCAGILVSTYAGEVPRDLAGLLALPGIGPYTARAVLAFAYDEHTMPVDTNIGRVLARVAGHSLTRAEAQAMGDSMACEGRRGALALMDLGATVCRPRVPRCDWCPLRADCRWAGTKVPDPAASSAAAPRAQAPFAGSDREGRGRLLRAAGVHPVTDPAAAAGWPDDPQRALRVVASLVSEGLLSIDGEGRYTLG
jgi:A/G-specific adenine glycosylase